MRSPERNQGMPPFIIALQTHGLVDVHLRWSSGVMVDGVPTAQPFIAAGVSSCERKWLHIAPFRAEEVRRNVGA